MGSDRGRRVSARITTHGCSSAESNRVRASSTGVFRDQITADGHHVLETTIPRREGYAQAFGAAITELGHYEQAAREFDALEVEQ